MIYIETWKVNDSPFGDRLQIAYTKEEQDLGLIYEKQSVMEEQFHCRLLYLIKCDVINDEVIRSGAAE